MSCSAFGAAAPLLRTCGRALFCCLASLPLSGQDLVTPLLSDSWQATFGNPALYGSLSHEYTVGLPGIYNDLFLENLTLNTVFPTQNGQRVLDLPRLPDQLSRRNEVSYDLAFETLGFSWRGDRISGGVSHRLRSFNRIDYPKTLVTLAARGNGSFVGQTVEIAPQGALTNFHEFGVGLSLPIAPHILIGGKIKYLSGIGDLRTNPGASLLLTTGTENFSLTLDQDLTLNSSGILNFTDLETFEASFSPSRFRSNGRFASNHGVALDLGIFVQYDRLQLQAAVQDLGASIRWKEAVTALRFSGQGRFDGVDVLTRLFQDSIRLDGAVDSLLATFQPAEDDTPYVGRLPATYLLGGSFALTDRLTAGALLLHRRPPEAATTTALSLSTRYQLLEVLTVGLQLNTRTGTPADLGALLQLRLGPLQLLTTTDNLLTLFRQRDRSRASLRVGAALAFGQRFDPEKPATSAPEK